MRLKTEPRSLKEPTAMFEAQKSEVKSLKSAPKSDLVRFSSISCFKLSFMILLILSKFKGVKDLRIKRHAEIPSMIWLKKVKLKPPVRLINATST
jgi:hypothetical protein